MSGRLVLLPKKSYTPWNPKNVERVEKDEQNAKEELEREEKAIQEIQSRQRLNSLKKNVTNSCSNSSTRHVNLFEKEERVANEAAASSRKTQLIEGEQAGVYLRQENKNSKPFYLQQGTRPLRGDIEDRNNMSFHDPMKRFYHQPESFNLKQEQKDLTHSTAVVGSLVSGSKKRSVGNEDSLSACSVDAEDRRMKKKRRHRKKEEKRKSRSDGKDSHRKDRKRQKSSKT